MNILWLCNTVPGAVRAALGGSSEGGMWMEHVLSDLRRRGGNSLRLLCLGGEASGKLEDGTEYALFTEKKAAFVCSLKMMRWILSMLQKLNLPGK